MARAPLWSWNDLEDEATVNDGETGRLDTWVADGIVVSHILSKAG